jgi:hypothetical protein
MMKVCIRPIRYSIILIAFIGCTTNSADTIIAPIPPTHITATFISANQVSLSWTDNSNNETGYKIQRKSVGGNFIDIATTGPNVTNFSDVSVAPNTAYTYQICAFNSIDNSTSCSEEFRVTTTNTLPNNSFTPGPDVTDIDGNLYSSVVTACAQIWTSKNLTVSRYRNGDLIPQVTDSAQWLRATTGAWCWYNNDSINFSQFGKIYNWYAVNDPRGLAPTGWHVPTDTEWKILVHCLDPAADTALSVNQQSATAGGAMKDTGVIYWNSPNAGATNSSGFAALPGGYRRFNGMFLNAGDYGYWWCAGQLGLLTAWYRYLEYNSTYLYRNDYDKGSGFSVRVVKD